MAADGVSMSLDDYIKTKKKGGGGGQRGGRGGGKPASRGKGQQGPSKGNMRYFNVGSGGARGGNQAARGGKGRGGGQTQRSPRGGVKNRNFNARNARPGVQGAKRGGQQRGGQRGVAGQQQQQRGRNRAGQAGPRRIRSQELIPRRRSQAKELMPRRSPVKSNRGRGRRNDRAELIPRDRLSTPIARGGRAGRGRGGAAGRNRQVAARRPLNPTNAIGRLRNRTVQQLVQKRIQRARLTLTKKTNVKPLRGLMSSRPRINARSPRGGALSVRAALAQQKLGRARQARGRGRGRAQVQSTRGLLLDRTQSVRIRVRNDQAVPAGTYTGYRPDSSSMGGYNPVFPSQDYYGGGGDSFQFPPMVLHNAPSTSHSMSPPSHSPFQEVLNPDIQKRIAMIQERGKPAETEVSPDFRYVSASRVKLGERFRSMMK